MAQIRAQIETTTSDFDREKLQERLAKLAGGVAVIKVGAATEVEMKEKKLRIEDALAATKAAVEEGIVAGGGTALFNAIPEVQKLAGHRGRRRENRRGASWSKPWRSPSARSPKTRVWKARVIIDKVMSSGKVGYGYDAANEEYREDMIASRHRRPHQGLPQSALQNAASVAAMVLTTESLVADKPEKNPAPAMPADPGMGGMY